MATNDTPGKMGLMGWSLWRLVTAPAVWLGSAAGTAVGIQMAEQSTVGAGIGFGMMVGVATSVIARGVHLLLHRSHADQISKETKAAEKERTEQEISTIGKMQAVGLSQDASVLQKMIQARDAIIQHSARSDVSPESSGPTLTLVSDIMRAALLRAEELVDLKHRMDDPLLDAPENAASRIAGCQTDLARAYRAVADARSRMLLHKELTADALLEEAPSVEDGGMDALAGQLENETAMLRGVERRMNQRSLDDEAHSDDLRGTAESSRQPELE